MKVTSTKIKLKVEHVNTIVLEKSIYKIVHERQSGYHWLYLHFKEDDRRVRTLWVGNPREIYSYLVALQHQRRYMTEPF